MRLIVTNIVRFFALIFIQIFVVNRLSLGFLNPYISMVIYISFLFTFPLQVSKYSTLLVALLLGLTVDIFQNTGGVHASACVFLAFMQPFVLRRLQTSNSMDDKQELNVYTQDLQQYSLYCFLLSFCFFFWLFLLEEFSFWKLPLITLKAILSSIASTFLIILGQFLLIRQPKNI